MDKFHDEIFKKLINKKNLFNLEKIEDYFFEYGKLAVLNFLDLVFSRIDQYQSLSSDDVIDIINEVYNLLYFSDDDNF